MTGVFRRLVRRGAVVVTALLGSLLVAPGVAHASATAETSPTVAFRAGESTEPPVARASVVLPDGDVVQGGELAAAATFGDVVLDPSAGSQPSFLARLSADGTAVRWAHDLGGGGHLAGLARSGTALVGVRSAFSGGAGTATAVVSAWDAATGQPLWENDLGSVRMLVEPDLAVAPDGTVLVAGTFSGWIPTGGNAAMPSAAEGSGFVLALDPTTGEPLWGRSFSASSSFVLQSVAAAPDGRVFAGGLFSGAFTDNGVDVTAPQGYGDGVVIALGPQGATQWYRTYDNHGTWPQLDNLVATDTQVFVRTTATVLRGWTRPTLSALSATDGTGLWSVAMPSTTYESRTAPLALLDDGTLVAGLTFSGSPSLAGTVVSSTDDQTDVALLGVDASTGGVRYVRRMGAAGDDRLLDATSQGSDLLLAGALTTPVAGGGVVQQATFVRMPASQRLSISVAASGAARSDLPFSVDVEPSSPVGVVVSGPCHLVSYAGGQGRVHLDHVGDCRITASTWALQVVDHLQVVPLVPTLRTATRAVTWPEPVPADPGYVFEDADGAQVAGAVTTDLPAGQVLDAGSYPTTVTFHSSEPDVADGVAQGTFLVARADAHVAFAAPRTLVYGATWSPQVTATGVDGKPLSGQLLSSPVAPGTTPDAGEYDVTMGFQPDNPNYRVVWDVRKLTVTKAATRLDARLAKLKQQLTATLTDVSNGVPLAGRPVVFYFGSRTCTAVTDATGNAVCALSALDTATATRTGVNAVYAGDRNHAAAAAAVPSAL